MSKRILLLAVMIFVIAMAVTASAVCNNTSTSGYTAANCDTCSNCDIASCLSCVNCDNANCDTCSNCQDYTDLTNCLNNGTCPTASWTADYSKLSAALNDASTCANSGCGYNCTAVENASTCPSGSGNCTSGNCTSTSAASDTGNGSDTCPSGNCVSTDSGTSTCPSGNCASNCTSGNSVSNCTSENCLANLCKTLNLSSGTLCNLQNNDCGYQYRFENCQPQSLDQPTENTTNTNTQTNANTSNTTADTTTTSDNTTTSTQIDNLTYEQQVAQLVNQQRAANGLAPLTLNTDLSAVARAKSQDMHDNNYFDHTSPTYGSPFEMITAFGISYSYAGENIAMGYATPQAVMDGWMNSPGHRANILNPNYTQIGVGYVANGNYWTQEFIG